MNKMGDYYDLYLKADLLLLADVFEKFVNVCLQYYELDPCHYFSSPGLSWDAILKMTGIELELISDINIHLFIEKGMRRGIFFTLLKDLVKQIINTWNFMIIVIQANVLHIRMQIIYMVGQ